MPRVTMHLRSCGCVAFLKERQGSSLVEFAIVLPVLILLMVGAIDLGKAYFLGIQVASAAQAGRCLWRYKLHRYGGYGHSSQAECAFCAVDDDSRHLRLRMPRRQRIRLHRAPAIRRVRRTC